MFGTNTLLNMAALLFAGLLFSRLIKLLKLPNVTGFLVGGLITVSYTHLDVYKRQVGQQEVHEHEAFGGAPGGCLYCWLTSFAPESVNQFAKNT